MRVDELCAFGIGLNITGIILHTIALTLINFRPQAGTEILQRKKLSALSLSEIWMCVHFTVYWIVVFTNNEQEKWFKALLLEAYSGGALFQYLILLLIVVDKFASVHTHLRYNNSLIKRKMKTIIASIAVLSFCVSVTILTLFLQFDYSYLKIEALLPKCMWIPLDILVVSISITVYGYFAAIRIRLRTLNASRDIFVSVTILTSFLLFYALPDVVYAILSLGHLSAEIQEFLSRLCVLCFTMNYTCDALSLLFLNGIVRRRLWRLLRHGKNTSRSMSECSYGSHKETSMVSVVSSTL